MVAAAALSPLVSQRMTSFTVQPNQRDLALLADLVERGQVAPVLDQTFALGEVADAIRHVEGGHTRGKTIVTTTRS
jgi:NADPH:quinone reductase-like Zn-dependent oxidoreductase